MKNLKGRRGEGEKKKREEKNGRSNKLNSYPGRAYTERSLVGQRVGFN
jgi:hypothetical protein